MHKCAVPFYGKISVISISVAKLSRYGDDYIQLSKQSKFISSSDGDCLSSLGVIGNSNNSMLLRVEHKPGGPCSKVFWVKQVLGVFVKRFWEILAKINVNFIIKEYIVNKGHCCTHHRGRVACESERSSYGLTLIVISNWKFVLPRRKISRNQISRVSCTFCKRKSNVLQISVVVKRVANPKGNCVCVVVFVGKTVITCMVTRKQRSSVNRCYCVNSSSSCRCTGCCYILRCLDSSEFH